MKTEIRDTATMPEETSPRRTPAGDERRQALVEAAFALLTEEGFEGLRVRTVAARVGINIATLHYYFPSKQDLVRGVVDYLLQQFSTPPASGSNIADAVPMSALRRELMDFADDIQHKPALFIVLMELQLRALRDPDIHALLQGMDTHWRNHLEHLCQEEIRQGNFRSDLDVPQAASTLIALIKGLGLQTLNGFTTANIAQLSADIEDWWRPHAENSTSPLSKGEQL
jgi:AcrR family transcriptional regulator